MKLSSAGLCLAATVGACVMLAACTPDEVSSKPRRDASEIYGTYKGTPMTRNQIEEIIKAMTPYTGEQAAREAVESKIVRN